MNKGLPYAVCLIGFFYWVKEVTNMHTGKERRRFLRYPHEKPLHYSLVSSPRNTHPIVPLIKAVSRNLSASGIFFITNTENVPDISSLVMLDLDYKTAKNCKEIEKRALIQNNRLLGEVVRIENNPDGSSGVGVAFITKSDRLYKDAKDLAK